MDAAQGLGAAAQTGSQEKNVGANAVSSDRVQLSKGYQDLAQAQKAVSWTSDIRTEKVQQIKTQLDTGNYQIKPDQIAQKMLDEII